MMIGYKMISLKDMLEQLNEETVKQILSDFCCPMNPDVEYFLKNTAITFTKQGISITHIIFASVKGKIRILAYFTLASKIIRIARKSLSKTLQKRLSKFAVYDAGTHSYTLSMPLIAQLGKNYKENLNKNITGDELLEIACRKVREAQLLVGGKFVYLECEDKIKLTDFYSKNGFVNFGKREIEKSEKDVLFGEYLIQMLKYIK